MQSSDCRPLNKIADPTSEDPLLPLGKVRIKVRVGSGVRVEVRAGESAHGEQDIDECYTFAFHNSHWFRTKLHIVACLVPFTMKRVVHIAYNGEIKTLYRSWTGAS